MRAACLKYRVAVRTYQDGIGGKSTIETLNARADQLIDAKKWGVAMLHAIVLGYTVKASDILTSPGENDRTRRDDPTRDGRDASPKPAR